MIDNLNNTYKNNSLKQKVKIEEKSYHPIIYIYNLNLNFTQGQCEIILNLFKNDILQHQLINMITIISSKLSNKFI